MFLACIGLELVPNLHEIFPHIPWVGCFQGEQVIGSHLTSRRWPNRLMSLNICSFPYAAQLRLGLEKLRKSSSAISDGTIIKSQCPEQIVVWVITSFFFSQFPCSAIWVSDPQMASLAVKQLPLSTTQVALFYGWVSQSLHIVCGMVREPLGSECKLATYKFVPYGKEAFMSPKRQLSLWTQ